MKRFAARFGAMIRPELLFAVLLIGSILAPPLIAAQTKDRCRSSCGNLTDIPFPFGLASGDENCHLVERSSSYIIDCEETNELGYPLPYMANKSSDIIVKDISVERHEMIIMLPLARDCYDANGNNPWNFPQLTLGLFPISVTRNQFTAVGCDTFAVFKGYQGNSYATGCLSLCNNIGDVTNGSCSGIGCCQTSIPKNVFRYNITLDSYSNHSHILDFNPCSFAFVAEKNYFNFSTQYLQNITEERIPVVLDWAVGSQTCSVALQDPTSYMCRENTNCTDADNGSGYRCYCLDGYSGNPYLSGTDGCLDIDECRNSPSPCSSKAKCNNLLGNFTCTCPRGYKGDGRVNGSGCTRKIPTLIILLSVIIGFLVIVLCASWVYYVLRQKKIIKEREKFYKQNGGLMLEDILSRSETPVGMGLLKVFIEDILYNPYYFILFFIISYFLILFK